MTTETGPNLSRKYSILDLGLLAVAGALCLAIALWPGGVMEFMHNIAEDVDVLAIGIVAALIGIGFVLLFRLAATHEYSEEVTARETL